MDNSGKIVLVDDEAMVTKTLATLLKLEGLKNTVSFNSPYEALEYLENNECDLVISDFIMPKMDGLDFLAKVREKHRELPIIICTAYNNYRHEFSVWNADGYILKSGNLTEIKDKIKRLIG